MILGKQLKELRLKLNITPVEIQKVYGGFSSEYILNVEANKEKIPNKDELRRYIEALQVTKIKKDFLQKTLQAAF